MTSFKLFYFPLRGRAESIRLLFAHAGVQFTDERIPRDQWPAMKEQMPLKQVPVLEVDGKVRIAQSTAILRYLAHQFGMAGKSPLDEARVDMLGEAIQDAVMQVREWIFVMVGRTPGDKDAKFTEVVVPVLDNIGAVFEQVLKENTSGWLVGDSVTWVDLHAAEFFNKAITYGNPNSLDAFPLLKQHNQKVFDLPNISNYIASRSETPF
uniref:glutathione transferase n=1 Tax=Plectus sambesii TaxID=2011161 RepID=A0A914VP22_9BILA